VRPPVGVFPFQSQWLRLACCWNYIRTHRKCHARGARPPSRARAGESRSRHLLGAGRPEPRWSRESGSRTRNTSRPNSGTSVPSSRPTRTRCTILLRVPKGLRQSFGSPGLVLLGDLRLHRRGLDAGVAELLLDDFQVGAAGPIQMRRIAMATRVRGVPGIQAHGHHEALEHPPDAVAGEGASLPNECAGTVRDIFPTGSPPCQQGGGCVSVHRCAVFCQPSLSKFPCSRPSRAKFTLTVEGPPATVRRNAAGPVPAVGFSR